MKIIFSCHWWVISCLYYSRDLELGYAYLRNILILVNVNEVHTGREQSSVDKGKYS